MFNGPVNLRKFHRRKRDKSCTKYPYFLCHKTTRNGIEPRQDLYLRCVNIRICRDLSPLGNLSQGVFFSVDLFFRRRAPINITGTIAGNPRIHHIKTFQLFFNKLFQITIGRSYRAAVFVKHVDTFLSSRYVRTQLSRGSKIPYWASLNEKVYHHPFDISCTPILFIQF